MDSTFSGPLPQPFYADHVLYHTFDWGVAIPGIRAWEFNGWQDESRSWVDGCYIHAGLSRTGPNLDADRNSAIDTTSLAQA